MNWPSDPVPYIWLGTIFVLLVGGMILAMLGEMARTPPVESTTEENNSN